MNEWIDIPNYPDFEACKEGLVRAKKTGRIIGGCISADGYHCTNIKNTKGAKKWVRIHRLVASAFLGESSLFVNHKDMNKTNNAIENLEYVTNAENTNHFYKETSMFSGTYLLRGKYCAKICINRKITWLGSFDTKEEAMEVYNKAKERLR